jgi:hypothetical protein
MLGSKWRKSRRGMSPEGIADAYEGGGAYSRQYPEEGVGHYVHDPDSTCPIHGKRLEACCDFEPEPTARDELHGHAQALSQHGIGAEPIREATDQIIDGRKTRRIAKGKTGLEEDMARREGDIETVPEQIESKRGEAERAKASAGELTKKADAVRIKAAGLDDRLDRLDRRYRISPSRPMMALKALAVVLFDLGVVITAFSLIPGSLASKVLLAIGLAFAPLVTSIGLASWLSAANHRVRFGRAAGRYALLAGCIGCIGLLLMIPFRAAAFGDDVIPPLAVSFLSIVQIALIMAETASWIVWFDAKVGRHLERRMEALLAGAARLDALAAAELQRVEDALAAIAEIERQAARDRATLRREEPLRREIPEIEEGNALVLKGVRDLGSQEGVAANHRDAERRAREGEVPLFSPESPA